jgi:mRNA interferase RelE/StbE
MPHGIFSADLGDLADRWMMSEQGDVKRLKGQAGCRLRIGDWRVILIEEQTQIIVAAIGHRREIYR